jgi:hypothetical protein
MTDFPRITAAAIGLGIVEQAIVYDTGRDIYVFPVLFAVIVVALLFNRRQPWQPGGGRRRVDLAGGPELRTIPAELRHLPEVRGVRYGLALALAVAVVTLPLWLSTGRLFIATETLIFGIVASRSCCSPAGRATSASARWPSPPSVARPVGGSPRPRASISPSASSAAASPARWWPWSSGSRRCAPAGSRSPSSRSPWRRRCSTGC